MILIRRYQVLRPFKFIWMKRVTGVNLQYHCIKCLLGRHVKEFNADVTSAENFRLESGTYYLCGGSKPYVWENNFHLAFREKEGGAITVNRHGIEIEIENAEELPISPEYVAKDDPNIDNKSFYTCRNWQFAHYYAQYLDKGALSSVDSNK